MLSKKILIAYVKTKPAPGKCRKYDKTWEHGTVQSFTVVGLWIVHDNSDFTKLDFLCFSH